MLDFSSEAGLRLKSLSEENFLYDLVDACHVCARACSAVTSVFFFFFYRECMCVLLFIYILFLRFGNFFSPCIRADLSFIVRFITSRCHISLRISREFGFINIWNLNFTIVAISLILFYILVMALQIFIALGFQRSCNFQRYDESFSIEISYVFVTNSVKIEYRDRIWIVCDRANSSGCQIFQYASQKKMIFIINFLLY